MKIEIWKFIKGYDGLYQVSSFGRVKSLKYGKEKILKPETDKKNYLRVKLCKNNKIKHFQIHRLVAMAFIPNPKNLPQVNHKDENPSNNNIDNLEWCTAKYNINYGTRTQKISKKVEQFDLEGNFIRTWTSMCQVDRELGISQGSISECCKGKRKSAGKFKWKFH